MPDELQGLLEYVRKLRAIDFSAYRQTTIRRRVRRRLDSTGLPDYASYHDYLRKNPAEMDRLIESLTIKVSNFFRNPIAFEVLRDYVLPGLMESQKEGGLRGGLRIWCAGSARGEEAYSLAILLKEIMEKEAATPHVLLLATDIDKEALADAQKARYGADALLEVKKGYLDKYFIKENGDAYRLKDEIRSMVTFIYHDLASRTPPKEGIFSDYHLILCRNVLIYFERELHERVLKYLSGCLSKNGCLALGEAETIPQSLMNGLELVMPSMKVFRKRG